MKVFASLKGLDETGILAEMSHDAHFYLRVIGGEKGLEAFAHDK